MAKTRLIHALDSIFRRIKASEEIRIQGELVRIVDPTGHANGEVLTVNNAVRHGMEFQAAGGGAEVTETVLAVDYVVTFAGGLAISVTAPSDGIYNIEFFPDGETNDAALLGALFSNRPSAYATVNCLPLTDASDLFMRWDTFQAGGIKVFINGNAPSYTTGNDISWLAPDGENEDDFSWWSDAGQSMQSFVLRLKAGAVFGIYLKLSDDIDPGDAYQKLKAGTTLRLTKMWSPA